VLDTVKAHVPLILVFAIDVFENPGYVVEASFNWSVALINNKNVFIALCTRQPVAFVYMRTLIITLLIAELNLVRYFLLSASAALYMVSY